MILGMALSAFTTFHVVLSLIGIAAGVIVVAGLLASRPLPSWTLVFLIATILTSITGYFFPVTKILPSHIVGAISLVALAIAVSARYRSHMAGSWRWIYVVTSVLSLYLNVFVLVVQGFVKIGALKALAPTQSEPPFVISHGIVLVAFVVIGYVAVRRFHPEDVVRRA